MTITIDGTSGIASVDGSAGSPSVRGSDANSGILYDSDTVAISTAGSERVRVSSGGKLLVGTTTDAPYGTRYLTVGDTSIDDVCLEIRSSSTTGRLYFTDSSSSGVGAYQGELTFDHNSGANRMHTKIAGTTKISVTTDGLTFNGDTAAANALSDYEEGTWTMNPHDGSCNTAYAKYRKVGNKVTIWGLASSFSDTTTNDMIKIKGLPYATSSSWAVSSGAAMVSNVDEEAAWNCFMSDDHVRFYGSSTGSFAQLRHNELNSGHEIYFSATYPVN